MSRHISRPLPFVLAATATGSMIVNHKDFNTFANGVSYGVGYQFLNTAAFDPQEVNNIIQLLHLRRQYFGDGVVALDCGANIGAHSIAWGIEMTHWGKVIAFEAQERLYYALAGNVALNNCFNVRAMYAAVGNPQSNQAYLNIPVVDYTRPSSFGSLELQARENTEFIGQNIDYNNTVAVPLMALDSLNLPRLDLMKIDVEGMEMDVLQGAWASIEQHKPILQIEILKSNPQPIMDALSELGYHFFHFEINLLAIHQDDPALQHINTQKT
ncbi:FkbM family methyltransferase [Alysiella filiformis]|nr:FkbM family methyltransferase [Alysiella filiformis]QMT31601.1 FkbM family methyltransferase [Alysiella filiformis]UBQ55388.1 FkbM family methyltransferase [Alysiella filiformis DSM 16848]